MLHFFKISLLTGVVFLLLDLIWLLFISKKLYQNFIGDLLGEVKILPAIIFYIIYIIGLTVFVILPSFDNPNMMKLLLSSAFFGFVCYATYDLTNLATLKNWPVLMTVIDLVWGSFVTMATVWVVYVINTKLFGG
ncbi:MAG: DUF2177 family protein [Vagococcus fluvialis]|uniref:DUF2177 family protein n=1 Tax=Vagococcus fluvialis TaxID=2738 RepID=UPI000A345DD5|nr:DUF2177 family protein [Vagococcus fluvialis]MBO0420813.1 DUF2177 family protein [Vagococcus fluvialis]OTP33678.1 hypothetical protein A5798_000409 [Enterococcus sp. 6C8_DIV0013]